MTVELWSARVPETSTVVEQAVLGADPDRVAWARDIARDAAADHAGALEPGFVDRAAPAPSPALGGT